MPSLSSLAGILCLLSLAIPSSLPTAADAPLATEMSSGAGLVTIRKEVREVSVGIIATDLSGRPVRALTSDQIRIFSDGTEIRRLNAFYGNDELPFEVTLLIDTSDSMTPSFLAELRAAGHFSDRIIRPSVDRVSWIAFAASVDALPDGTEPSLHPAALTRGSIAQTALFDAVREATIRSNSKASRPSRRALIVLSDGEDNWSRHSFDDAVEAAQIAGIAVYAITAHDPQMLAPGDDVLKELANQTGGRAFVLESYDQAHLAFRQIEEELRSQYLATFAPPSRQCGFHTLKVVTSGPGLRVQARSGYWMDGC